MRDGRPQFILITILIRLVYDSEVEKFFLWTSCQYGIAMVAIFLADCLCYALCQVRLYCCVQGVQVWHSDKCEYLMSVIVIGKHWQLVAACLRNGLRVIQIDTTRFSGRSSITKSGRYVSMAAASLTSEDVISTILSDRTASVDQVMTGAEQGILACGAMNDLFGSKGLSGQQAWASRHKSYQKYLLAQHGITVARGVSFINRDTNTTQALAMAESAGFSMPFVLKPAIGGAAKGVSIIRDVTALDSRMRIHDDSHALLMEEYIAGDEWHLDGFINAGSVQHILVSRYGQPLLMTKSGYSVRSFPLDGDRHKQFYERCSDLVAKVFQALSIQTTVFHVELFSIDGEFVVGEVASRPGGGMIPEMCAEMRGFDLWSAMAGAESSVTPCQYASKSECHAFTILAAPETGYQPLIEEDLLAIPGVRAVRMRAQLGQPVPRIREASTNGIAFVHVVGQSHEECEAVMDDLERIVRSGSGKVGG
jgi:hypothetical protein